MNPLISVIVPVYKVEQYLNRCLDSILNQTYKNLEIILVDDGSPDNCGKICDEYAKKDSRVRVIHKENAGVSAARNTGLDAATGDYIGFVDSDDWLEPDMYEFLLLPVKEHHADISTCGLFLNYENGTESQKYNSCPRILDQTQALKETLSNFENAAVYNKIIRANLAKSIRFDESLITCEDWMYNYLLVKQANVIVFDNASKYHYFQRTTSATSALNESTMISGTLVFEDFYEREKENPTILPSVAKGYYWVTVNTIINAIQTNKTKLKNFKVLINMLKKKESALAPYLSKKEKILVFLICHCLKLYQLNMKIRHRQ